MDGARRRGSSRVANGASLLVGLFTVWALAAFGGAWPPAVMIALGAVAGIVTVWLAARMGVLEAPGAWLHAPSTLAMSMARLPGALFDAAGVALAALGGRRRRAGFVRIKWQAPGDARLAEAVEAVGARPGLVVVDADGGSALVHALDEEGVDIEALKAVERRVRGGKAAS